MFSRLRDKLSRNGASAEPDAPVPQKRGPRYDSAESKRAYSSLRWGVTPSSPLPPAAPNTTHSPAPKTTAEAHHQARPQSKVQVRKSPSISGSEAEVQACPAEHPVHKLSVEERDKLRCKGINPISRAEMDDAMSKGGKRGFWTRSAFGGGWGLAI